MESLSQGVHDPLSQGVHDSHTAAVFAALPRSLMPAQPLTTWWTQTTKEQVLVQVHTLQPDLFHVILVDSRRSGPIEYVTTKPPFRKHIFHDRGYHLNPDSTTDAKRHDRPLRKAITLRIHQAAPAGELTTTEPIRFLRIVWSHHHFYIPLTQPLPATAEACQLLSWQWSEAETGTPIHLSIAGCQSVLSPIDETVLMLPYQFKLKVGGERYTLTLVDEPLVVGPNMALSVLAPLQVRTWSDRELLARGFMNLYQFQPTDTILCQAARALDPQNYAELWPQLKRV